jgi:hypothetical protein
MPKVNDVGISTGDTESSCFGIMCYLRMVFYTGGVLGKVVRDFDVYRDQIHELGQYKTEFMTHMLSQVVDDLVSGDHYNNSALDGSYFIKQHFDKCLEKTNDEHALSHYHHCFISLAFWKGDYETVIRVMEETNLHRENNLDPGCYVKMPFYFHIALSGQLFARQTGNKKYAAIARKICKNNISACVKSENPNVLLYELLVKAETEVGKQNLLAAERFYDSAILFTQRRGFTNDLALAHELKAKSMLAHGNMDDAMYHMRHAARSYQNWGAPAKTAQLAVSFPTLFAHPTL